MANHVHTGPISILFAGLSAILVINLVRLGSAKLATMDNSTLAALGRTTGALVHFSV